MPFEQVLTDAARSVLEMMFFAETEPGSPAVGAGELRIRICFDGRCRGGLTIEMPEKCARAMAASFEGVPAAEALPEEAVHHVAAELSNMICGAALARLDPNGLFNLRVPLVTQVPAEGAAESGTGECWLQVPSMENGLLHLVLALGEAA
jgi:CheY-specific phosphatase CheX